jgi:CrcB protein
MTYAHALKQCLAIGLAGFCGALARIIVSTWCGRWFGTAFPIGILIVNVSGCFLLGLFLAAIDTRGGVSDMTRLAIAGGFVGAYTTFSTFIYDSNYLFEAGKVRSAALNLVLSIALGLLAVRIGVALGRRL